MQAYLLKRFFMTVLVLLLVITFLSLLVHIVPGDPAKTLLVPRANPDLIAKTRAAMDLDKSVPVQVRNFLWSVLHGSFGTDVFTGRSINELVGAALPHTLILAWVSLGLATLIGVPLGVYSATHPDSWPDRITAVISISFVTIPSYVAGLDVSVAAGLLNLLKDLREQLSLTYIIITHNLNEIGFISDRVAVMYLGKIVELAPTEPLFTEPKHPYTEALMSAIPVPDPRLRDQRQHIILEGEIPSARQPPPGCPFHPRCDSFMPGTCDVEMPVITDVSTRHYVRCHLYQ